MFTFASNTGGTTGRRARWHSIVVGLVVALSACAAALLSLTGLAGATTGTMPLSKPPIFSVSRADGNPFLGRYKLSAHSTGLISGSLLTGWDASGYLEGSMAIYAYNGNGQEISWIGTTYEYRYAGDTMHIDLWDPDGTLLFGHAALKKEANGNLVGSLEFGRTYYKVTFAPAQSGQNIYNTAPGTVDIGSAGETQSAQATTSVGIFSVALEGAQVLASKHKG